MMGGKSPSRCSWTYLEDEPVPGILEELPVFHLGPLLGVEQRQHDQVHTAHDLLIPRVLLAGLEQTMVVDDDPGAGLQGWDE